MFNDHIIILVILKLYFKCNKVGNSVKITYLLAPEFTKMFIPNFVKHMRSNTSK